MTAPDPLVADAVTNILNDADEHAFTERFKAERTYIPEYDQVDTDDLTVRVVQSGMPIEEETRTTDDFQVSIDVGIMKKLEKRDNEEIDPLRDITVEILDFLDSDDQNSLALADDRVALLVSIQNEPIFVPAHIKEFSQYTSVITAIYSVSR